MNEVRVGVVKAGGHSSSAARAAVVGLARRSPASRRGPRRLPREKRSMRTLRAVAAAVVLSGWSVAQAVWSMGAPWPDLGAVVASAAPGDIVLLNGLTFPALSITKGLTILGPGTIEGVNPSTHNVTSVQVAA